MNFKKLAISGAAAATLFGMSAVAVLAATVLVVTPSNTQGWVINPAPANATPYEFNTDEASIGVGSLYVEPIGSTSAHKFIATKALGTLVSDVNSISYDFLIAGNGDSTDASQFYLNVYTNVSGSTTFYDCRFDYVPSTGSTGSFTTASFSSADTPTAVADRPDAFTCPATLAGMPSGSTVSFVALNVGDTSASDIGLAGYYDKVVVDTVADVVTYDFEPYATPSSKDECKNGGWEDLADANGNPFKNQGQCVSYFNHL